MADKKLKPFFFSQWILIVDVTCSLKSELTWWKMLMCRYTVSDVNTEVVVAIIIMMIKMMVWLPFVMCRHRYWPW